MGPQSLGRHGLGTAFRGPPSWRARPSRLHRRRHRLGGALRRGLGRRTSVAAGSGLATTSARSRPRPAHRPSAFRHAAAASPLDRRCRSRRRKPRRSLVQISGNACRCETSTAPATAPAQTPKRLARPCRSPARSWPQRLPAGWPIRLIGRRQFLRHRRAEFLAHLPARCVLGAIVRTWKYPTCALVGPCRIVPTARALQRTSLIGLRGPHFRSSSLYSAADQHRLRALRHCA